MVCPVMTGPMCGYKHGKHHQVWENDWVYSFNMSPEHPNPQARRCLHDVWATEPSE